MKSNLVKIIGTLGLIIAIAVILKSVFGIGKIGVSKTMPKSDIKKQVTKTIPKSDIKKQATKVSSNLSQILFENCYDSEKYQSFEEQFIQPLNKIRAHSFRINPIEKRLTETITKRGGMVKSESYRIEYISEKYIKTILKKMKIMKGLIDIEQTITVDLSKNEIKLNTYSDTVLNIIDGQGINELQLILNCEIKNVF